MVGCALVLEYLSGKCGIEAAEVLNDAGVGTMQAEAEI